MTETTAATQASSAAGASESGSVEWLRKLDAGELSRAQAIDGLVKHALEAHGGAHLPETQRPELEQVVRVTLLDDPVLSRLIDGD